MPTARSRETKKCSRLSWLFMACRNCSKMESMTWLTLARADHLFGLVSSSGGGRRTSTASSLRRGATTMVKPTSASTERVILHEKHSMASCLAPPSPQVHGNESSRDTRSFDSHLSTSPRRRLLHGMCWELWVMWSCLAAVATSRATRSASAWQSAVCRREDDHAMGAVIRTSSVPVCPMIQRTLAGAGAPRSAMLAKVTPQEGSNGASHGLLFVFRLYRCPTERLGTQTAGRRRRGAGQCVCCAVHRRSLRSGAAPEESESPRVTSLLRRGFPLWKQDVARCVQSRCSGWNAPDHGCAGP
eukprot:m.122484 g.122484  ORF g.122484 m.122484 type:complete len:301 (-) comp9628_c0_seq3:60-962(-)